MVQEVSDPISKATWDNYAMISPQMGKSLFDIDIFNPHAMDKYEVTFEKPVIKSYHRMENRLQYPVFDNSRDASQCNCNRRGLWKAKYNKDKTCGLYWPCGKRSWCECISTCSVLMEHRLDYSATVTIEQKPMIRTLLLKPKFIKLQKTGL